MPWEVAILWLMLWSLSCCFFSSESTDVCTGARGFMCSGSRWFLDIEGFEVTSQVQVSSLKEVPVAHDFFVLQRHLHVAAIQILLGFLLHSISFSGSRQTHRQSSSLYTCSRLQSCGCWMHWQEQESCCSSLKIRMPSYLNLWFACMNWIFMACRARAVMIWPEKGSKGTYRNFHCGGVGWHTL